MWDVVLIDVVIFFAMHFFLWINTTGTVQWEGLPSALPPNVCWAAPNTHWESSIHVQNPPYPCHGCGLGEGYSIPTCTCTRMHPCPQPTRVYKPMTFPIPPPFHYSNNDMYGRHSCQLILIQIEMAHGCLIVRGHHAEIISMGGPSVPLWHVRPDWHPTWDFLRSLLITCGFHQVSWHLRHLGYM